MKALTVFLNYSSTEASPASGRQTPLALPLRVLDADGSLIAEGAASTTLPAKFDISAIDGPAFVRLTWPSGKTQTQRVDVEEGGAGSVSFDDARISRNEWSAWAVPRLGEESSLATPELPSGVSIDKFDRVWLRMWTYEAGSWTPSRVEAGQAYRNDAARQLDFELDTRCRLLQLGGANVPWRFVALPGGGSCRVLLTPNESTDPRAEPLKVIVTSFRRDAEALLEFLARDSLRAATAVASYQPLAKQLMENKNEDPVSAVAGAYFLLRTDRWRTIPRDWFDNLVQRFPWLSDPPVIRCMLMIRHGFSADSDAAQALALLRTCLDRGVPMFSEGLLLLQEAASVLRSASGSGREGVFEQVERLTASQAWAGAALSFYGETPDQPSPERIVGLPGRARPHARKASSPQALLGPQLKAAARADAEAGFSFLRDLT
ncbi:MAG: hypothetical protein JWQ76_3417 [Ramlibacter sp.]|nr:hypothetical protein [Ramlibacter sp.]